MTENTYLMTVKETVGEHEFTTGFLIEADSENEVREEYEKTLDDWGFREDAFKNGYTDGTMGSRLIGIKELDEGEVVVLQTYLNEWTTI